MDTQMANMSLLLCGGRGGARLMTNPSIQKEKYIYIFFWRGKTVDKFFLIHFLIVISTPRPHFPHLWIFIYLFLFGWFVFPHSSPLKCPWVFIFIFWGAQSIERGWLMWLSLIIAVLPQPFEHPNIPWWVALRWLIRHHWESWMDPKCQV